jgi:hypothetical protein
MLGAELPGLSKSIGVPRHAGQWKTHDRSLVFVNHFDPLERGPFALHTGLKTDIRCETFRLCLCGFIIEKFLADEVRRRDTVAFEVEEVAWHIVCLILAAPETSSQPANIINEDR